MKSERIKIKVKRLRESPGREIPLPRYMTEQSSGMDLLADVEEDVILSKENRGRIKIIPVETIQEVLEVVLEGKGKKELLRQLNAAE